MTNIDKIAVLSTALNALSVKDSTKKQAEQVADILVEVCQALREEEVARG